MDLSFVDVLGMNAIWSALPAELPGSRHRLPQTDQNQQEQFSQVIKEAKENWFIYSESRIPLKQHQNFFHFLSLNNGYPTYRKNMVQEHIVV